MKHAGKLGTLLIAALLGTSATAALAQSGVIHSGKKDNRASMNEIISALHKQNEELIPKEPAGRDGQTE
jgi:hypothetical protein